MSFCMFLIFNFFLAVRSHNWNNEEADDKPKNLSVPRGPEILAAACPSFSSGSARPPSPPHTYSDTDQRAVRTTHNSQALTHRSGMSSGPRRTQSCVLKGTEKKNLPKSLVWKPRDRIFFSGVHILYIIQYRNIPIFVQRKKVWAGFATLQPIYSLWRETFEEENIYP